MVGTYLLRRLMVMIPTLLGITVIYFAIINMAPGGPIEQALVKMQFGGAMGAGGGQSNATQQGQVNNEVIEALKRQYGFDKPAYERYLIWLKNVITLDFGESFHYDNEPVIDIIKSKFPVSLQFGIISLILTYLICIPLGVFKAMKDGTSFDAGTSVVLFAMYSIPGFVLGIILLVFFSSGNFLDWFPVSGLFSDEYEDLNFWGQIKDRIHHFILPLICYMIGQFTVLTMLMKNSLLDEIKKDYIRTARAKGLDEKIVFLKHGLRNALIPVVTGLGGFLSVFFAGSLLIETIFGLDGIGLMSYNAVLQRDYNLLMGSMFIQSALMLIGNLISDMAYIVVDPRIDFR